MSLLTLTFIQEIEKALTNTHFLPGDFTITTEDYTSRVRLEIVYKYMSEFTFKGDIYKVGEKFEVECIPGAITKVAKIKDLDKYHFIKSIHEWLGNAYSEMQKIPMVRKLKEQEDLLKSFQEKIQSMDEEGEKRFLKEEGDELRNRLDKLEEELKQAIIERNDSEREQQREFTVLHSEIETLKSQLEFLNKKNWFLSLSTRIFSWIRKNPQLARNLAGATKEMLPESAKGAVSEEVLDLLLLPPKSSD